MISNELHAAGMPASLGSLVLAPRFWKFGIVDPRQERLSYLDTSRSGFVLNRGAKRAAVTRTGFLADHPRTGRNRSSAGLMLNFALNRAVVFRSPSLFWVDLVLGVVPSTVRRTLWFAWLP